MFPRMLASFNLKAKFLVGLYWFGLLVFGIRLIKIQVIDHPKFRAMAQEQYTSLQDLPAKRGDIMSKDGFTLATTQASYLMYAEPKNILDKSGVARQLAKEMVATKDPVTSKKEYEYFDKYSKYFDTNAYWIGIEREITPAKKEALESLKIKGIGFELQPKRYYPENTLASHILGFVASNDKGDKQGYEGVEGVFDLDLRGRPGRILEEKDALGEPILLGSHKRIPAIDGSTIVLSIDRAVQYLIEKKLKQGVEETDSVSGTVIVMDPMTGDIIALANYPTYDPQKFDDLDEESLERRKKVERKDLAISETYEPGSVIKALTMATALDLGKVTEETTFEDNGPVEYSTYFIDNWNKKHYGIQNMVELLQKSNNIGAAWVGHRVGAKELSLYFNNFGLGKKSGIDLQGEEAGIFKDYNLWTDIDLANISFGQGLSATPLQVLNAFNALANGGKLLKPRIVEKILDDGREIEVPVKVVNQVISKNTSDRITKMLVKTVEGGEAKYFNLKEYNIAGKTGTAQIFSDGKYNADTSNATFVGYLDTTRKFSMIVRLDRPKSSIYAAETAVPLWMSMANDLVKYYGIAPDNLPETVVPSNVSVEQVPETLNEESEL